MATAYVRLRDANPAVNPGWMDEQDWLKEVEKTPKDLDRLIRVTIGE